MRQLPNPVLAKQEFCSAGGQTIEAYTDEALFDASGVRVAFTTRAGGVSTGAYSSLNLGSHVNDDAQTVEANRHILCEALTGSANTPLLVPNQVHGDTVLFAGFEEDLGTVNELAAEGADALVIALPKVAANLCFADCCPLIAVAPNGYFAVIHAGWRGVANLISVKALDMLAGKAACAAGVSIEEMMPEINVYIGAHIHAECFETGAEVHERFTKQFGAECTYDETHIDLNYCLRKQLTSIDIAPERIADVDKCTVCNTQEFFSYRAQDGIAGRHGAFACAVS